VLLVPPVESGLDLLVDVDRYDTDQITLHSSS
jgi:hypothetical protein